MTLSRYEVAVVLCVDYRYETEFGRIRDLLLSKGVGRVVPFVDGNGCHLPINVYDQISMLPDKKWNREHSFSAYSQFRAIQKIFKRMSAEPYGRFLFVEDDLELLPSFDEVVVEAHGQLPDEWDMIYYGANHAPSTTIDVGPHLMRVNGSTCTHCVGINRSIYDTVINMVPTITWDAQMAQTVHPKGKSFAVWPTVAVQKPGYSHLQKQKVDYTKHWSCRGANR